MAATRAELTAHVGGRPSSVQRTLIERVARLKLYIELMDAKAIGAGGMTERDSRQYLAWSNALGRALRDLGLRGQPVNPPTSLSDYLASKSAARASTEAAER